MFNLPSRWTRLTLPSLLLLPVAGLFAFVVWMRRLAYRRSWRPSFAVGVPVVIVGNITAGGSGKTPLVIWLVNWLSQHGYRPGVVSRGYGGSAMGAVEVHTQSDPAVVGDEPLLIHYKTSAPVVVGRDRVQAARTLLARHPGIDIIVADDGLQHYRLHRDLELAVLDARSGLGNGLPLPAGPLREPASRLETVDALVQIRRGDTPVNNLPVASYQAEFALGKAYALTQPDHKVDIVDLPSSDWLAATGIGQPQGFFDMLTRLGWDFRTKIFSDHHRYQADDIPAAARVVMTEKDAVKCLAFAQPDWWALELEARPEAAFIQFLEDRLKSAHHPAATAHPR
ncbi:MAG: tetraacyldisaccharide 4'-kinase [Thiobacillaceae bacterium]